MRRLTTSVPKDSPLWVAWKTWQGSEEYKNLWSRVDELWVAFSAGWAAGMGLATKELAEWGKTEQGR